ncbi:MAG: hypothetical protein K2H40_14515, partial [Lachnospiraceae bacterium]|nr:hypothetical protein [Lachnospiraceae bacterium]
MITNGTADFRPFCERCRSIRHEKVRGMEMQIGNIVGVNESGGVGKGRAHVTGQKSGRARGAAGSAESSKEVQEKLRQGAEGATVAISAEGLGLVKKEDADENASAREEAEKRMYQEMLENTKEAAEAQGEGYEDLAKALEIARRILNGDIVPAQDEQFLMEFNSEIYMRVKSMAESKEDPEEYDSLLEEEED